MIKDVDSKSISIGQEVNFISSCCVFFVFHCLARLNAALKSNTVDCLLCTGQKTRNPPRQVALCCSMECMYNNSIRSRTHRGYCFNRLLVYYWWNVVDMNVFCLTFTIVVLGTNNSLWLKSYVPQSLMYSNLKAIFPALLFSNVYGYTYIDHIGYPKGTMWSQFPSPSRVASFRCRGMATSHDLRLGSSVWEDPPVAGWLLTCSQEKQWIGMNWGYLTYHVW